MQVNINNLTKKYGDKTAVSIPVFSMSDNEIVGLVGNNGSGKTTFFRLLTDLVKANTGEVSLNGVDPTQSESWKQHTGVYLDEGFLIDYLTPEEYFDFVASISDIDNESLEQTLQQFATSRRWASLPPCLHTHNFLFSTNPLTFSTLPAKMP